MRAVGGYAAVGAVLLAVVVLGLRPLLGAAAGAAVAWMAVLAWAVQLVAFALLRAARRDTRLFLTAWVGGTVVRLGLLGVVGFWVMRSRAVPAAPALLALAGSLFGLMLLEPVFFRMERQGS